MHRLIAIAAFALMLAVPVCAQRGGGHGGGGGHFGGGMHASGGSFGGGRSFSGMRSGGMRSGPSFSRGSNHSFNRGLTRGSFRNRGSRNRTFRGHRFHEFDNFGFRNNCVGFACRNWGWGSGWGWGWSDPWVWSSWEDEDRRFDEDYYRQYAMADDWNERNLEEQRMMRQEEADEDQDVYAPRSSNRRSSPESSSQAAEPVAATVLVFRDHHQQEIQNYAIVGQILWAFSSGRTQKVPMADLDLPATQKANDDRGVTFRAPASNQGNNETKPSNHLSELALPRGSGLPGF